MKRPLVRGLAFVLVIGAADPFFESNLNLSRALHDKQIPHDFHVWDGEMHRSGAWRRMARCYL